MSQIRTESRRDWIFSQRWDREQERLDIEPGNREQERLDGDRTLSRRS